MVKLLGAIDLFAAFALFSINGGVFHLQAFLLLVVLLAIKGGSSFRDVGGITDLVACLIVVASFLVTIPSPAVIFVAVVMLVKGAVSVFS